MIGRRRVRSLTGLVEITSDRGRCGSCRCTHVLLPAFVVPRRGYTAEMLGSALLAGIGQPTGRAGVDVPVGTARRWRAVPPGDAGPGGHGRRRVRRLRSSPSAGTVAR
jgi:hypothetical protein